MRTLLTLTASLALLAACTPPAERPDSPPQTPDVLACNQLAPNPAQMVSLEDEVAVAAAASDLRGGAITPGAYDLVRAMRLGGAPAWPAARAATLEASEAQNGAVTLNYASIDAAGGAERWTATFTDTPAPQLGYTCGRTGAVDDVGFSASAAALTLRLPDQSGTGALQLEFRRRA